MLRLLYWKPIVCHLRYKPVYQASDWENGVSSFTFEIRQTFNSLAISVTECRTNPPPLRNKRRARAVFWEDRQNFAKCGEIGISDEEKLS